MPKIGKEKFITYKCTLYIQHKSHDVECTIEVIRSLTRGLMFETWISLVQIT